MARADLRERFEREAKIAARVASDHVVEVIDAGVDGTTGMPFLAMELLDGADLGRAVDAGLAFEAEAVVALLHQAALALRKTHAEGILHRDLKPENLFLARRDDWTPKLKILDFGLAKVIHESAIGTQQTGVMGTPLYMAPEQFDPEQPITLRADLYALGHIAYALLVGCPYWNDEAQRGGGWALVKPVCEGAKVQASVRAAKREVVLSSAFDKWFSRATALRPSERFTDAVAQVEALAEALDVPFGRARLSLAILEAATRAPASRPGASSDSEETTARLSPPTRPRTQAIHDVGPFPMPVLGSVQMTGDTSARVGADPASNRRSTRSLAMIVMLFGSGVGTMFMISMCRTAPSAETERELRPQPLDTSVSLVLSAPPADLTAAPLSASSTTEPKASASAASPLPIIVNARANVPVHG